jgi:nucleotidyltransferase/DNA polymerase involved in DNA repair
VGIAPNKLLAKLASGRAKPNGVCTVLSGSEIAALLGALPAARMPGCGGKIGDTFAGAGVGAIADLQVLTARLPFAAAAKIANTARFTD